MCAFKTPLCFGKNSKKNKKKEKIIDCSAQELCESRGRRPWLPVPNKPMVSVDLKQHFNITDGHSQSDWSLPVHTYSIYIYIYVPV